MRVACFAWHSTFYCVVASCKIALRVIKLYIYTLHRSLQMQVIISAELRAQESCCFVCNGSQSASRSAARAQYHHHYNVYLAYVCCCKHTNQINIIFSFSSPNREFDRCITYDLKAAHSLRADTQSTWIWNRWMRDNENTVTCVYRERFK